MTKHLILARHAEIGAQYAGRFVGSTEATLSELGRRQALALAASLAPYRPSPLVASPMRRAVETVDAFRQTWQSDDNLREIDFGRWERRSFSELAATEPPDLIEAWNRFDPAFAFPEGESLHAFTARVADVSDRLASLPHDTVVVVTHGGVIRAMLCHLLGLEMCHYLLFKVERASNTRIDLIDGRGVLAGLNDRCHLKELES